MAETRVSIGFLLPLGSNRAVDNSAPKIPIYEGNNIVGRNNLTVSDKRVSRKHISLRASIDGSADVMVEGPNPIIFISGDQRKKLGSQDKCLITHGDILELIPGNHLLKYVTDGGHHEPSSKSNLCISSKGKRQAEDVPSAVKRNRQILEDEAVARKLQNEQVISSVHDNTSTFARSGGSQSTASASSEGMNAIRDFSVPKDKLSFIFRLMRVHGLPAWANSSSVAIDDVIQGNVLVAVLSNYMVDIDWLMSACPDLRKIPHVLVVHGESGATVEHMKSNKPANWILHKPPLPISYGTHHSKAMLLIYSAGVRVVVHTANLIYVDWNNKTQGLWMQDFPWKEKNSLDKGSLFENDLVDYLSTLKWPGFSINLPGIGNVNINASFFKKFDYSSAMGNFKVQEDKKHRAVYQSLIDSEKKLQFFSARQVACRLLGSRGYLCQKCWLVMEDCMCSKLVSSSLWHAIRFWIYMHPKDFLRQNNTGKLLWQIFGTQAASMCLFGIDEHEEIMWDSFRQAGKNMVWFLYPNKNASPKSVQDIFDRSFTGPEGYTIDLIEKPLHFVLIDGTWSNSAAMYRRLKEKWTSIWGEEDLPCVLLSATGASVMHKLRPQPSWDRTCTAAAAAGVLSELSYYYPRLQLCGLDKQAEAVETGLNVLLEALSARRVRMGRCNERNKQFCCM